jgi:xanthine dehydrogenase YagT iron-sulfur-binding subunit
VQPALHALLDAIADPWIRHGVTRREFLFTAVALAVAAGVPPRWARAADADVRAAAPLSARGRATSLNVNGIDYRIDGDARITLLDALRERIGLIGTKKSCDHGQCGACTVHVDGRRVNSCLVLARQAEGTRVVTIEGLAQGGRLHPMQAAFIEFDGFQCGYCTSGQIMSAVACVREGHARDRDQIREWMSGNVCRCGAYNGICSAIERARGAEGGRA